MDLHKTCKALGMLLLKALDKNVCRRVCTQWHEQGQKKYVRPYEMQAERREDQSHEGEAGRGGAAYCYFMI